MIGKAQKNNLITIEYINLRDFGIGNHQTVDGRPFGGGPGMVFRPDVLVKALESVTSNKLKAKTKTKSKKPLVIFMSASGKPFKQNMAWEYSKLDHIILIAGHYEGVDQRFIDKYVDQELSIGDYVLTGGELPAMVVIDSITRLIPGVLNKEDAAMQESFSEEGLLEYPQYTKPRKFKNLSVPDILLSGNHQNIDKWRHEQSVNKTKKVRPELLVNK